VGSSCNAKAYGEWYAGEIMDPCEDIWKFIVEFLLF